MKKRSLRKAITARKRRFSSESRPQYIGDMDDRRLNAESMAQHFSRRSKAASVLHRAKRMGLVKGSQIGRTHYGNTTLKSPTGRTRDVTSLGRLLNKQPRKAFTRGIQQSFAKNQASAAGQRQRLQRRAPVEEYGGARKRFMRPPRQAPSDEPMGGVKRDKVPVSLGRPGLGLRQRLQRRGSGTHGAERIKQIGQKILSRVQKRGFSDKTMGISRTGMGDFAYRSIGGQQHKFYVPPSDAAKAPTAVRKTYGMAGKRRPSGPSSAAEVSAARKKAWTTRRKKFGKSGGNKRR